MLFFVPLVLVSALASRDRDDGFQCATNCTAASNALQACGDNANCLCNADTVTSLHDCEQCMFAKLVEINQKMDFRVGSQAVLNESESPSGAAYASSCQATINVTLAANQTALQLPSAWDGPFVAVLPVPAAAAAVGSAAILGSSALYILWNL
ncbi:hypothetical protein H0H87_000253 [Tephrocybe sp. NHM501043]|nr:hypothetical protein H0H87_000253 [Tephrocybe sp. NHM501043]